MACLKFLQKIWQTTVSKGGHDGNVLSSLRILEARPGHIRTSLKIDERHLNNHNTIHGGVILSLTDTVTSLALSTHGIPAPTGVSVNISTEFVRPGGVAGDDLEIVGSVLQLGRTLAYTRAEFFTPTTTTDAGAGGKLVAYGSQTKFMGKAVPTTKFSKDGQEEIGLHHDPKAKL